MRRTRLSATLATLALTATLAGTATATAAPPAADAPAAPSCVKGYVCVQPLNGFTIRVPEGSRQDFDPPLAIASVVNETSTGYCLTGTYNRGIAPGSVFEPRAAYSLRSLTPSPNGYCLATDD
ncbi:hypothetical protein AA958_19945 [Streptomyces sp. CNQ-509]|uniref:hypothetical protein n=1 Tax=unclassified Streptomyces TaxID=2593676 RepID=UPI00062E04ED|nr:hypothetical protein [Streptomyces sp. CNQ-509]AKH84078.1 hypothetical protein AA958_19945 [Streptomyces sp. CNQ-509]